MSARYGSGYEAVGGGARGTAVLKGNGEDGGEARAGRYGGMCLLLCKAVLLLLLDGLVPLIPERVNLQRNGMT